MKGGFRIGTVCSYRNVTQKIEDFKNNFRVVISIVWYYDMILYVAEQQIWFTLPSNASIKQSLKLTHGGGVG